MKIIKHLKPLISFNRTLLLNTIKGQLQLFLTTTLSLVSWLSSNTCIAPTMSARSHMLQAPLGTWSKKTTALCTTLRVTKPPEATTTTFATPTFTCPNTRPEARRWYFGSTTKTRTEGSITTTGARIWTIRTLRLRRNKAGCTAGDLSRSSEWYKTIRSTRRLSEMRRSCQTCQMTIPGRTAADRTLDITVRPAPSSTVITDPWSRTAPERDITTMSTSNVVVNGTVWTGRMIQGMDMRAAGSLGTRIISLQKIWELWQLYWMGKTT